MFSLLQVTPGPDFESYTMATATAHGGHSGGGQHQHQHHPAVNGMVAPNNSQPHIIQIKIKIPDKDIQVGVCLGLCHLILGVGMRWINIISSIRPLLTARLRLRYRMKIYRYVFINPLRKWKSGWLPTGFEPWTSGTPTPRPRQRFCARMNVRFWWQNRTIVRFLASAQVFFVA